MYHQNHYMVEILAKARHEQLLEYSKRSNLNTEIQAKRIILLERMVLKFGEMLISFGTFLKNRYQPKLYVDSIDFRADSTNTCISKPLA